MDYSNRNYYIIEPSTNFRIYLKMCSNCVIGQLIIDTDVMNNVKKLTVINNNKKKTQIFKYKEK
ncbi:hypothetical protein NQ318_002237 [Aromia moschata]|uniref:Uncharacterized protein n=1 Tax=Aromia moschata TaxID=1265417 RepID=A0AAV8Z437_9CUCU|nr:hypothetical protein NQ318_002237 [Aromia moschata]